MVNIIYDYCHDRIICIVVLLKSEAINIGEAMKPFSLPNTVDGQSFSDKDIKTDVALVAFICNHCPYVIKIVDDFSKLAKKWKGEVQFVAISANDPDYREDDSPEKMTAFAEEHDFTFPYLFDESQKIARDFGAVCTPDLFVYKKSAGKFKLAYHGRFEDLDKVFGELSNSDLAGFEQLPSMGCSIKWRN